MTKTSSLVKTLPTSFYTDDEIYEIERRNVFGKEWLYVAHISELPEPGDYITTTIAGYNLLLLNNQDGIVGYKNICRHRGATLLTEPSGKLLSKNITCRYHAWSYGLEGELVNAPYFDCESICELEDLSLIKLRVETFNGLIFVNLNQTAQPLSDTFNQLFSEIENSPFDLSKYKVHSTMTRIADFNWKVWVEGYQECYHCANIHPLFARDFELDKYRIENQELYSVHSCPRKNMSASGKKDGLWLFVYPNLGLPIYQTCFYTKKVNPLGTKKTEIAFTFHVNEGTDEKTVAEFKNFIEEVTDEDIEVCLSVQKNMDSGSYQSGFLHEERENGVIYFQELVRNAVSHEAPHYL